MKKGKWKVKKTLIRWKKQTCLDEYFADEKSKFLDGKGIFLK